MSVVLDLIIANSKATGGYCGTTLIEIRNATGIPFEEIRDLLNKLHSQGKIQVRKGINHQLIFAR